ncbi:hypothetical protein IT774_08080 [Salinimonas marina]|uniref:Uncharacterized protein n=1 Tax=Salinimonas marina TaxID=2785918 RepID=A0A7S9E017_9ALTE|nr:YrzE family protein [Salinimonas marina]QPG07047.1 hypothetical protein IT774_08080 [Salinimonas marina]
MVSYKVPIFRIFYIWLNRASISVVTIEDSLIIWRMDIRKIRYAGVFGLAALFSPLAFAQAQGTVSLAGHFFTSVLAGVIIAVGIQFLLSNLAIALGISAVGDLRDNKYNNNGDSNNSSQSSSSSSEPGSTGTKVISGLGIFSTVTMSISLFIGTWLALDLAQSTTILNGAITGLIIWALFFIACLYFDIKFTTSITGRLFSFIQTSLTKTGSAVSGIFSSRNQPKPEEFAQQTVKAIHDEIRQEFDVSEIDKKIKSYIDQASSNHSPREFRKEIEKLIHEIEIEEQYTTDDPDAARKLILEVASKQSNVSDRDKKKLSDAVNHTKTAMREGGSNHQKATAAFDKLSPSSEDEGQKYRQAVSDYLDKMGQDEVSSEQIEKDLETIFNDPSQSKQVLRQRIQQVDRNTIKAAISSHKDMDEQKADRVLSVFDKLVDKAKSVQQSGNSESEQGSQTTNLPVKRTRAETRVQDWFDRTQRPELKYRDLKADFMEILDDPKMAPEILSKRVSKMDDKTVRALLTNNNQLDESDIDEYMAKYNEAKDDLLKRLDTFQSEAKTRMQSLQNAAFDQSEAVRKTAASAAWWIFVSALVSAGSALLAGRV